MKHRCTQAQQEKLRGQSPCYAYEFGFWEAYDKLRHGDPVGIEKIIRFLEADPIFFGTGYVKAKLIRYLTSRFISSAYVTKLQRVVLHVVDTRDDRDFREYCRLARRVDDATLREALAVRLTSSNPNVRRRSGWVLSALGNHGLSQAANLR